MVGLLQLLQPTLISSFLILTSFSLIVYYYLKDTFSYWSHRGIPHVSFVTCLLNVLRPAFGRQQLFLATDELYKKLDGHRYGGIFQMTTPTLLLRDPEAIKLALVKGFTNFHDRGLSPDESFEPLSGNLVLLTGEKWRQVRRKLSPAFSTVSLKVMHQSMHHCAQVLNTLLQKLCSETGDTEVDVKELMFNYAADAIVTCTMGVECDALQNPDSGLKEILQKAVEFNLSEKLSILLNKVHPKLPRYLRLKLLRAEVEEFLIRASKNAIEMKEKDASSTTRKDFLQAMLNLRSHEIGTIEAAKDPIVKVESPEKSEGTIFSESVLMGVTSDFLFGGFEPIASTLIFCLYELALHPEIQDKVFKEIQTLKKDVCDDISYEDLKKLLYTDQVINETLRKYPVAGFIDRICTEPFKMPDPPVVVEKDARIIAPVFSLHQDPQYFPEPEKFDPDRFSEANIDKIVPGSYLPFGDGPRNCLAMRFSLLDVKTMLITLVSNYTLHACKKTPKPMEFDNKAFILKPKGGVWLRLQKRK